MKRLYQACLLSTALLLCLGLLLPAATQAQNVDNKGKEFIMPFLPNFDATNTTEVHLTSDVSTMVTVEYPVNSPSFTETVSVNPGDITIVEVPNSSAQGWAIGSVDNNAVRASSDDDFVAYMINRRTASTDAALALPKDALNTQYLIATYRSNIVSSDRGEFGVVAAFDDTEVEIIPTQNLQGGFSAGTPFTISLDKGEGFLGQSTTSGASGDLTGTSIDSDKPVSVTNGNKCTNVPPGTTACDHVFEFAHAVQTWGESIPVAPLPNRPSGSIYRVLAAEDNTTVTQDGSTVATLDRGEFYDTPSPLAGEHVFAGDQPIFVYQFMTGDSFAGADQGDPAMGNMIPSDQYLSAYTFSTIGGDQFAQHFLSVIADDADVSGGTILLDGAPIAASEFNPVPGTSLQAAVVELEEGTHTTSSVSGGHGITVEGYNNFDSYIYPGGALFQFINQGDDENPPICEGSLDGLEFFGSVSDDENEDDTGVFFVELSGGSTNLQIDVDDFTPGDPLVNYSVSLIDPNMDGTGTVIGTDGAGNQCTTEIEILVDDPPPPPMDDTPPVCGAIEIERNDQNQLSAVNTSASDLESGIASVEFTTLRNLGGFVDTNGPFAEGETYTTPDPNPSTVEIRGERIDFAQGGAILTLVTNGAGLTANCDPVVERIDAELPGRFALSGNAPNPFRGETTIGFSVAEAASVRLVVYDLLGRRVATLADEELSAGRYEVRWDGRDGSGQMVAPGVYLYRIEAGAFSESRRMVLVR